MTQMTKKLARLYGADLTVDARPMGCSHNLCVSITGIKDQFALEGEKLTQEYAALALGTAFHPYFVGSTFDPEAVGIEKQMLRKALEDEVNDKRLYCQRQANREFFGDSPAGVAHFLEHKMFEDEDGDAFAKFAKTGANANAFTAFDRTCYLFTATEQLDESLDVLLGMVGHPYFTEQTIAKEQGIIGQEIKMYDDSPDWRLITGLCECLYHSHPIRSDIAGTVESIAEITPEMLYDCCKAFYAPGNMVLAAAGNTSMEQILAACARHGLMDERPAEKVERLLRPEPMTLAAAEKTIAMPIAKPCFGLGFKEEPLPFGDLRSEMLYELILCCICGGMSPLYRRLYDEGLTNPGFGGEVLRVDGCCCILFTGESDQPDTVRQLLLDEIERVRKEGVDREIFTLCKNEKYGQLIENLENVEDSASQMADFALAGQTVAQQITMLAGLTAEDADAALQHILRPERMAVMYIEPDGTAVEEDEEEETEE